MRFTRPASRCVVPGIWPVKLEPRKEGGLWPKNWHGIDQAFEAAVEASDVVLTGGRDLAFQPLDRLPGNDRTMMIAATVELNDAAAAGLSIGRRPQSPGFAVLLDRKGGPNGQVSLVRANDLASIQTRY